MPEIERERPRTKTNQIHKPLDSIERGFGRTELSCTSSWLDASLSLWDPWKMEIELLGDFGGFWRCVSLVGR